MGKTFKQRKRQFEDDYHDEQDNKGREDRLNDRRVQKRLRNALRKKNFDDLEAEER